MNRSYWEKIASSYEDEIFDVETPTVMVGKGKRMAWDESAA